MKLLAIDPGSSESALVWYDVTERRVVSSYKLPNDEALRLIQEPTADHLAIEMAESFGAKVWSQVFTTVLWTGRFVQAWSPRPHTLVTRREVKLELAGSPRAKDGQIRNVLIDRWGGKERAIGTRKQPGPLYGITADRWQALAIGVTWSERLASKEAA